MKLRKKSGTAITNLDEDPFLAGYATQTELNRIAIDWRMKWLATAHSFQVLPGGDHWTVWLLLAGRGSGKTKCAANNIGWWAWTQPRTRGLVMAPTANDIRFTCFEGDSGLLNTIPAELIDKYNKSTFELELKNGSHLRGISADSYERLRGPQFHYSWCLTPDTMIEFPLGQTRKINEVKVGDKVQTRFGVRQVIASGLSNNPNPIVTISCGAQKISLTEDHPLLLASGEWCPAGQIKEGDYLWTKSNTKALHGINDRVGITTIKNVDIYTDIFGKKRTESLRQVMSFITLTTIPIITILTILCLCLRRNISAIIDLEKEIATIRKNGQENICLRYTRKKQLPASCVVNSLSLAVLNLENFVATSAKSVTELIDGILDRQLVPDVMRSMFSERIAISSVPQNAEKNTQTLSLCTQRVTNVERSPSVPTYNLTVEGEHEFIANGFIVHNCDELAAFEYLQEAWDMMMFGLRLGHLPRVIATTTPKPKDLIWQLVKREGKDVVVDRASSYQNLANLAPTFKAQITQYEGTKLGRQEIHAEIIDPFEAGVVKKNWIKLWPYNKPLPIFEHIVYSLDTAFTEKTYEKDTYDRDPTACTVWGLFQNKETKRKEIILLDCWDDYFGLPDLIEQTKKDLKVSYGATPEDPEEKKKPKVRSSKEDIRKSGRKIDTLIIEDKGSGISLRQMLAREGIKTYPYNPGKADKLARLHSVSHFFYHGIVWFPESETKRGEFKTWTEECIKQLCSYAGEESIKHDDYVDSTSQSLIFFADKNWLSMTVIPPEEIRFHKKPTINPYSQ